jgi:Rhodanese-related sulfurtransferase
MFEFIKNLLKKEKLDYTKLMGRGALIIDVRTPQEFAEGKVENSVNIPLSDIMNHLKKIKEQNKPVITCCRSGARSEKAKTTFISEGIEAYNGGSWNEVQAVLNDLNSLNKTIKEQ